MAFPTAVNDKITDSVTQANLKVLDGAPAIALGNLYQALPAANTAGAAVTLQQQAFTQEQNLPPSGITTLRPGDGAVDADIESIKES